MRKRERKKRVIHAFLSMSHLTHAEDIYLSFTVAVTTKYLISEK